MDYFYTNSTMVPSNTTDLYTSDEWECRDNPAGFAFWMAIQVLTAILGLPANVTVLWILLRKQTAISSSEVFILNLAVIDALFCLNTALDIYNNYGPDNSIVNMVNYIFYTCNVIVCPLFLCCICVERYVAMVHPVTYLGFKSLTYRVVCSAMAWAITLAFSIYLTITENNILYAKTSFISVLFIVMIFCNLSILRILRRSAPGRDEIHPMMKKAFHMVFTILMLVLVSYSPVVAMFPFKAYFNETTFLCYIMPVCYCFFIPRSFIQPLLYLSNVVTLSCVQFACNGGCCVALSPTA